MNENIKAHLALISVAIIYGLNYTIAKDVMVKGFMTPFGFIMMRTIAGLVLFLLFHTLFIKETMEKKDIAYAALCSVFGVAINMLAFFEGLKHTSPIHGSLFMVLCPILILLISAVIIKERITNKKIFGILIGLLGAAILIIHSGTSNDKVASFYGDALIMLNATSFALYLVLVRKLMKKYHPITVIKWVFVFGTLLVIPFGGNELLATDWASIPQSIWLAIGYVLFFTTFLTYLLNGYALTKVLPSTVGFYIYFQPLIATAFAIACGKDHLDLLKIVSAICLFYGVFLINKQPVKQPKTT
ncbi:MAG: DMT family transporter [Saprospiraceae bacterium]|nr:DMT family transporter [Saprospiraceae bacterium]